MNTKQQTLDKILSRLEIEELNAMQQASIAANRNDNDVILLSATGSGKTLAFLLPLLEMMDDESKGTQAVVIVPSRDLAQQIEKVFKTMGTGLKITCCYGGHARDVEEKSLQQVPVVIVGTPGRLSDHIRRGHITTSSVKFLILDEFDKSLELGFQDEMSYILESLPAVEKRILTSATESLEIPDFVGLKNVEKLDFLSDDEPLEGLTVRKVISPDKDKLETLFQLLCYLGNNTSIVFCNHRESVERTSRFLLEKGIYNEIYHGALDQKERDSALFKFRNGSTNTLVTTDLAARGLDIPDIGYIIHYHLPANKDIFTHRNGRTARMNAEGTAIVLLSEQERVPFYLDPETETLNLPEKNALPEKPQWVTLYLSAGKKDKINKVDIAGFLFKKGQLSKDDVGLIEIRDFFSFVAVRKTEVNNLLRLVANEKIKNKKILIERAK